MKILKSAILLFLSTFGIVSYAQQAPLGVVVSDVRPMEFETFFFSFKEGKSSLFIDLKSNKKNFESFLQIVESNRSKLQSGEFVIAVRSYDPKKSLARARAIKLKSYLIKSLGIKESNFSTLVTDTPIDSGDSGVTVGLSPCSPTK